MVCVGGSPNESPEAQNAADHILTDAQKQHVKAFYCQGGFNYEKMNVASKLAMKMFVGSLKKKKDEKPQQMAEYISKSYDISDKKFIEPVVEYLRGE